MRSGLMIPSVAKDFINFAGLEVDNLARKGSPGAGVVFVVVAAPPHFLPGMVASTRSEMPACSSAIKSVTEGSPRSGLQTGRTCSLSLPEDAQLSSCVCSVGESSG